MHIKVHAYGIAMLIYCATKSCLHTCSYYDNLYIASNLKSCFMLYIKEGVVTKKIQSPSFLFTAFKY